MWPAQVRSGIPRAPPQSFSRPVTSPPSTPLSNSLSQPVPHHSNSPLAPPTHPSNSHSRLFLHRFLTLANRYSASAKNSSLKSVPRTRSSVHIHPMRSRLPFYLAVVTVFACSSSTGGGAP